jgi:hypothetical protein
MTTLNFDVPAKLLALADEQIIATHARHLFAVHESAPSRYCCKSCRADAVENLSTCCNSATVSKTFSSKKRFTPY